MLQIQLQVVVGWSPEVSAQVMTYGDLGDQGAPSGRGTQMSGPKLADTDLMYSNPWILGLAYLILHPTSTSNSVGAHELQTWFQYMMPNLHFPACMSSGLVCPRRHALHLTRSETVASSWAPHQPFVEACTHAFVRQLKGLSLRAHGGRNLLSQCQVHLVSAISAPRILIW